MKTKENVISLECADADGERDRLIFNLAYDAGEYIYQWLDTDYDSGNWDFDKIQMNITVENVPENLAGITGFIVRQINWEDIVAENYEMYYDAAKLDHTLDFAELMEMETYFAPIPVILEGIKQKLSMCL